MHCSGHLLCILASSNTTNASRLLAEASFSLWAHIDTNSSADISPEAAANANAKVPLVSINSAEMKTSIHSTLNINIVTAEKHNYLLIVQSYGGERWVAESDWHPALSTPELALFFTSPFHCDITGWHFRLAKSPKKGVETSWDIRSDVSTSVIDGERFPKGS